MMFFVRFGSAKRERAIRALSQNDLSVGVILAATHFEWMMKRAILKLGVSPTQTLRDRLERLSSLHAPNKPDDLERAWKEEVAQHRKTASLGTVLGQLTSIRNEAIPVRGKLVHGNGTPSRAEARRALGLFLGAGPKLRGFAVICGEDLDTDLKRRLKPRKVR
jgi:hypothetical protein